MKPSPELSKPVQERIDRLRFPLMGMGFLALLTALWGGLIRLGWALPSPRASWVVAHGPLMVAGFLGTLIGVERAVALRSLWTYLGPLLSGFGALLLVLGISPSWGIVGITLGSLGLVLLFSVVVWRHPALFTMIMGLGALLWFGGNLLWLLGQPINHVVLWWLGFLLLTIAGERLELSRLLQLSSQSRLLFLSAISLFLLGLALLSVHTTVGTRLIGISLLAIASWLLYYDMARRTVRQTGLTRFMAVSLLSGYVWLGISGLGLLLWGNPGAGPRYDVIVHAFFLGFVFAMIFGHAPVIFPAVLRVPLVFSSTFYVHLLLLHLSLLLRVAGDLSGWWPGRQWGGLLNAIALFLFFLNTGRAIRHGLTRVERRGDA